MRRTRLAAALEFAVWGLAGGSTPATPCVSVRLARKVACSMAKGLFIRNSACCGAVVCGRSGVCVFGLAKSNVRKNAGRFWRSMKP